MSYQVLARKWRPRRFSEMVGQEHVMRALINALDNDRLHHAFLFTGTRGVGKTTIARILAKSLNCEQGMGSQPCGQCSACTEIDEGRFVDLIEVDAASRTKVEDTRELLENVQYAPTRGRYKVYLIDEVHMLSNHSFNALLKTLEEPPPHVKFLLATTDPQKLPVTILSRCLQFNLKRLSIELIRDHLVYLLGEEGVDADPAALLELAFAADGSMRDALSLLDQAIAYGAGVLRLEEVRDMLGSIDRTRVVSLVRQLAAGDAAAVIAEAAKLAESAPDYRAVLNDLNALLQRIALAQAVPEAIDNALGDRQAILELAAQIGREEVQLFYQIGTLGRRDLPLAPEPRSGFEMVLLRMLAFTPHDPVRTPASEGGEGGGKQNTPQPSTGASSAAQSGTVASAMYSDRPAQVAEPLPPAVPAAAVEPAIIEPVRDATLEGPVRAARVDLTTEGWSDLVATLPLAGMSRQFAEHCALLAYTDGVLAVALDRGFETMRNPKWEAQLEQVLSDHLGETVTIRFVDTPTETVVANPRQVREQRQEAAQQAAETSINSDPRVQAIVDHFSGRVEPGSIRPLNS